MARPPGCPTFVFMFIYFRPVSSSVFSIFQVKRWRMSCIMRNKIGWPGPMKGNSLLSYFFEYLKLQSSMYMICYDFSAHLPKDIYSQLFGCSSPAGN